MTTIMHTTNLGGEDRLAFEHSVALAHAGDAMLVAVHANATEGALVKMPEAHPILERWGHAPESVSYRKQVHSCCDDPVDSLLSAVRGLEPDLVVATTHHRSSISRFFRGSRAEGLAENINAPILLFSAQGSGFVAEQTGAIELRRILVPVGDVEAARVAVQRAIWLAQLAGVSQIELECLHVGDPAKDPAVEVELPSGWTLLHENVEGERLEAAIVERGRKADVIVMATRHHDSVGDVLLGSHTERVLHETNCPLLSVGI